MKPFMWLVEDKIYLSINFISNFLQVYHLPLLPGYAPSVNVRSSPAPTESTMIMSRMSEDEQYGYEGTYFPEAESPESNFPHDGYISTSPEANHRPNLRKRTKRRESTALERQLAEDEHIAEAIFFSYGVAVFFGFSEMEERDIIDDLDTAGIWTRKRPEEEWEVEECHYTVGVKIVYLVKKILIHSTRWILMSNFRGYITTSLVRNHVHIGLLYI